MIGGAIVALLSIIYGRIVLELILAVFRILETNREIAYLQRQQLGHTPPEVAAGEASQQFPSAT